MTAANKKFQQLRQKVHFWRARDYLRDKEDENVEIEVSTKKFKCRECGHVMFYQAKRCPVCEKEGTVEELRK